MHQKGANFYNMQAFKIFRHDQYHKIKALDKPLVIAHQAYKLTTQVFKKKSLTLLPEKHPALLNAHSRFEELNSAYVEVQNSKISSQMSYVPCQTFKGLNTTRSVPNVPCHILKKP